MTITTVRNPRGSVQIRANEVWNPRIVGMAGWQALWFGTGGTGTDSYKGTELDKTWTNTPSNVQDSGWRYHHAGWAGTYMQKTVSGYFYPNGFEPNAAIKARYYNSSGGLIYYDTGPITTLRLGQGWQRISGTFTCPPGTAWTDVDFVLMPGNNPQNGQGIAFQQALIEPGGTLSSYFDGTTYSAGNGTQYTDWSGTADNSPSRLWDADPATSVAPLLVLGWDEQAAANNVFHQLLSGAVVLVQRAGAKRSGTLKLFFNSRAAAMAARSAHQGAGAWTYTDTDLPETAMVYAVNGPVHLFQDETRNNWELDVPFQEI